MQNKVLKVLEGGPHTARAIALMVEASVPEVHRVLRELDARLVGTTPDDDRGIWASPKKIEAGVQV